MHEKSLELTIIPFADYILYLISLAKWEFSKGTSAATTISKKKKGPAHRMNLTRKEVP
jgi:hypothetical protein